MFTSKCHGRKYVALDVLYQRGRNGGVGVGKSRESIGRQPHTEGEGGTRGWDLGRKKRRHLETRKSITRWAVQKKFYCSHGTALNGTKTEGLKREKPIERTVKVKEKGVCMGVKITTRPQHQEEEGKPRQRRRGHPNPRKEEGE